MPIFDDENNEVHLTVANVIAPVAHAEEARAIASSYMHEVENADDWQPELMLPTLLSPSGQLPATHCLCSMRVLSHQVPRMAAWIAAAGHEWCAEEPRALADVLTDSFCICEATRADFLTAAGLAVIE